MKRNKTASASSLRVGENYIFYTCLLLVLAIAALGLASDVIGVR